MRRMLERELKIEIISNYFLFKNKAGEGLNRAKFTAKIVPAPLLLSQLVINLSQ